MHVRVAFAAGFLTHYLFQRETLPLDSIASETAALRSEIKVARESVLELQLGQDSCVWKVWLQQWLLRLSLILDLLVAIWIIWRFRIRPSFLVPAVADVCGSSSDTDNSEPPVLRRSESCTPGKGVVARGRPSRPSDFKGGK